MPDLVNGLFELLGGLLIALSCRRLYLDKQVKGVSLWPVLFFNSWGMWNLYFYPSQGCWLSFLGGLSTVTANTVWVGQIVYYSRRRSA